VQRWLWLMTIDKLGTGLQAADPPEVSYRIGDNEALFPCSLCLPRIKYSEAL
jgi:hypothetical protein